MAKRTRGDAASPSCLLEETRKLDKHPNKLLEGLNRLRLNKVFCDVVLCCGGKEFPCHRVVLASISSYFEGMFTTGMLESTQDRVNVDGVEPEVVDMLVSFAYTSEVSISTDNVQALLAGADLMDVIGVREACCDYMERHMTIYNCVEIHLLADKYSCEKLEKSSLDYILEYFSVIYKQEEFLSVSVDKLTEILSSDHLNVPEEDMVFDAAILWLNTCTDRRLTFDKVLEHIRLPLIRPSHLHTVIESLDVVKEHQGCQRFVSEAKTYQRLVSEAGVQHLLSYRNTARPRRTTVIVVVKDMALRVYSFHPRTNQWTLLRRVDGWTRGPHVVASDTGSVLYVAGGRLPNLTIRKEMWCFDLHRGKWLKRASMNEARYGCGLVMLDGCLFALGGVHDNSTNEKSVVERYDPNSNTWQRMKSGNMLYFDYVEASLMALDGLIYVFGGQNTAGYLTPEVECFNPKTNQWTMCAPMRNGCLSPPVAVVDEMIYVLGTSNRIIERYCAETDTWETIGKTPFDGDCVTLSVRLRNDAPSTADDDDDDYVQK